ncbi:ATP-binding protein [Flavobacterium sp. DG1-102-2]|uniref:ATP-binding protein n=1 Tax=Flavobacterium sp. DG1-102-2 TaxID=3081663 RepID=UPI00294A09A0|nr:ATP-binding protein [Flavobacterium sp. DG1-102-2]MDV6169513.1 ATP-binding protein [Flavobacterium sp. DG1-102-2]
MLRESNPFSDSLFVGFVTSVSPTVTQVSFPSSLLLKKFYSADNSFHALTGEYVIIEGSGNGFLGKITEIALPENERLELTENKFEKQSFHPKGKIEILLCFDNYILKAKKGLNELPPVSAKVFLCSNEFLNFLMKDFGNKEKVESVYIPLATLPKDASHVINISSQSLFGRHCAVVGTTGGGKSWTIAKLIEEVQSNNGKAILIDATGEFKPLSNGNAGIKYLSFNIPENQVFIDYKNLKESDLIAMFRPAGQTQLPKFQEALRSLRLRHIINNDDSDRKNHNTVTEVLTFTDAGGNGSSVCFEKQFRRRNAFSFVYTLYPEVNRETCFFDIKHLSRQIQLECVNEFPTNRDSPRPPETSFGSINDRDLGNCHSLISRIRSTLSNKSFSAAFGFSQQEGATDLISEVEKFINPDDETNILILSVEHVSTENNLREILVNAIGRLLLEASLHKKFKNQSTGENKKSLLLFLDEAHLFLNKKIKDEYSIEVELNAFERIAKECRKYGLFLVLSTQMPRDIPRGVLSQMGTFIVHRLINQQDREAIEFACSDANKSSLAFLPILSSGEALLTGVDFPMPMIIKVIEPNVKPDSETPKVF